MGRYVNLLVDKSFIQSLNSRESRWLFHTFQVVCPHVFFYEIVADINKAKGSSKGSGLEDVKALSNRIDTAFLCHHERWEAIVEYELRNHPLRPDGRPCPEGMIQVDSSDGKGIFIDQTPLQRVVDRWRIGEFSVDEKDFANLWRQGVSSIDLEGRMRRSNLRRTIKNVSPQNLMGVVSKIVDDPNSQFRNLSDLLRLTGVSVKSRKNAVELWKARKRPELRHHIPYGRYILRCEVFFHLGVSSGLIGTRNSNVVDFEYFKFLPFVDFFASNDKLHADFSNVLYPRCGFASGSELKSALSELADYYDCLGDEMRSMGSMTYAEYPPIHQDNAVTKLFDKKLPNWRDRAAKALENARSKPAVPRDVSEKLRKHLREIEDASRSSDKNRNPIVPSRDP